MGFWWTGRRDPSVTPSSFPRPSGPDLRSCPVILIGERPPWSCVPSPSSARPGVDDPLLPRPLPLPAGLLLRRRLLVEGQLRQRVHRLLPPSVVLRCLLVTSLSSRTPPRVQGRGAGGPGKVRPNPGSQTPRFPGSFVGSLLWSRAGRGVLPPFPECSSPSRYCGRRGYIQVKRVKQVQTHSGNP